MSNKSKIEADIAGHMRLEDFLRIHARLNELKREDEQKLQALAELQQYYNAAGSDKEREKVRSAVAQIREISRQTREDIRLLKIELSRHMPLDQALKLYQEWKNLEPKSP